MTKTLRSTLVRLSNIFEVPLKKLFCVKTISPTYFAGLRDVSSMSDRFRKSMEELYGAVGFVKMWENWVDCMAQIRRERQEGDICRRLLSLIQCDTLVVHGEKDHMVPKSHATLLASEIKKSR